MSQEFLTTDVLRLEVQEAWADLINMVENPSGEFGSWGWGFKGHTAPVAGGIRVTSINSGGNTAASTRDFAVPVVTGAGTSVRARVTLLSAPTGNAQLRVAFYDSSGNAISTVDVADPGGAYPHQVNVPATTVPSGTVAVQLIVSAAPTGGPPAFQKVEFGSAVMVYGATAAVTAASMEVEPAWVDVLGPTHAIDTDRDELEQGTLRATVISSTYDPATNDLIHPGHGCRLRALIDGTWELLFRGALQDPSVAYELKNPTLPDEKRTVISLVANDPAAVLANTPRPDGVGTIDELRAVLLDAGVPWNVNGSTAGIDPSTAVVVSRNENATALDQLAITRDSVLGYAWVDREGIVQAWDAASLPTVVAADLDESDYSDLDVGFDLSKVFNVVLVKVQRINPGTGETEEVTFGPYVDEDSARRWRRRQATFTVQGIDEASVPAYAKAILDANANPAKRVNSLTLPVRTITELEAHVLRDLYDLVTVSNARAALVDSPGRVTSVKQVITSEGGGRWSVTLGFTTDGGVATPLVTPSPPPLGGKTLAQLLRPIGEVTMWFGAKADCPAGWLVMDGTPIPAEYTSLIALVGPNLPNMTDRFPIGAGSKALGTSGGAASVTLNANHLPPHTHPITRQTTAGSTTAVALGGNTAAGTGATTANATTNTPVDILNPWRSLWFIIRAA